MVKRSAITLYFSNTEVSKEVFSYSEASSSFFFFLLLYIANKNVLANSRIK
ncbi:hypothetical protein bcere0022_42570 [Bacillus cereus Rock3-44]|nr:hypothetical protein bcere0022_42570 [Bacillus cereus Rock3-44]